MWCVGRGVGRGRGKGVSVGSGEGAVDQPARRLTLLRPPPRARVGAADGGAFGGGEGESYGGESALPVVVSIDEAPLLLLLLEPLLPLCFCVIQPNPPKSSKSASAKLLVDGML